MQLLKQLFEQVLLENAISNDEIVDAIDNHKKFIATYKPVTNGHEHATGPRLIGFFAYGVTKKGNECVRIYEYAGDTASFVPDWKIMLTSQFETLKDTGQVYYEAPEGYNPSGDRTMAQVYKIAKFGEENAGASNPETRVPGTDLDSLRQRTSRIKQQMANPINIKDLQQPRTPVQSPSTTTTATQSQASKPEYFKTDTERGLERLRQQLQNPRKIDLNPKPQPKPVQQTSAPTNQEPSEEELQNLRTKLGDTSQPIPVNDLKSRLFKTDTERGLENLKQQLQNAKKIDLTKIPKR